MTASGSALSGTINEIAYFDSSSSIASLAVATYPSLTELSYVKGLTSAAQTQITAKAPSTAPTFATSITGSYLTASEILITGASKEIVSAAVATYPSLTELTYVKGVTSAIQTQMNLKAPLASPTFTGTVTIPLTPSNTTDAASKGYVDGVAQGLSVKGSVLLATAAALPTNTYLAGVITITATGTLTVDGTVTALNDRILVKDEVAALGNGIYKVTTAGAIGVAAVLTRSVDMDVSAEFPGAFVFVEIGTVNAAAGFVCTNSTNPNVGTDAINFTQFSGAGEITAGAGMTKTGNTLDVIGTANRITVGADAVDIGTDVVTLTGTQTVTNKTFTSPKINEDVAITATATELNYTDGVTSAIQTQLNAKAATLAGTINEIAYFSSATSIASLAVATYPSLTELSYVKGLSSAAQTQITAKAPSTAPTFATSITGSYLTASEMLITGASKEIISAPVATYPSLTELTYLKGVTSALQTQINAKGVGTWTDSSTSTGTNKTLTAPAINAGTLSGIFTLAESTSIDLDPAQADQTWTGITRTGTAGATLAFGDLCYLAVADSRWELTDADAAATSGGVMLGMCVLAAAGDGSATRMLLLGNIQAASKFPALTIGAVVYVGDATAGAIQVAIPTGADNIIRAVGFALTADEIYFNPSQDHQVTVA